MDTTSAGDVAGRRKRKSRFSDAVDHSSSTNASTQHAAATNGAAPLDPVAIAKAAAERIARAIPGGLAVAAPLTAATGDVDEQMRLAQEKRRRTDQIFQSVQQQMNHIQSLVRQPGNTGSAPSTFMPAPLLLDEHGRQIDANGNVIEESIVTPVTTLKLNRAGATRGTSASTSAPTKQQSQPPQNQNPYLSHRTVDKEDAVDTVDPRLMVRKRETRAAKSFQFVTQGTYVKQGEQVRARDAKKMLAGFTSGRNPRGYQKESIASVDDDSTAATATTGASPAASSSDATTTNDPTTTTVMVEALDVDVDVPPKPETAVPAVEWWDIEYLPKDKRAAVDKFGFLKAKSQQQPDNVVVAYTDMKLKLCATAHVIEHPARVASVVKRDDEPVVLPLMLTAAERKKIRRQNRADREKEKQDKIAAGLLPPPEPKVKLSNMMRVLADQAVADPSAIERKVREQVAQREKNHEMRNLARKLTPEERREKKLRKIKADAAGDIHVAVFKVPDLSNPQHRFKVDVNAQQFHLTGGVLLCAEGNVNLVVVEGGRKAIKHYSRLLTKRIDWLGDADDSDGGSDSDSDGDGSRRKSNGCRLVWQGVVARKAFANFRFQECRTAPTARKVMEAKGVAHYWDLVANSSE